MTDDWPSVGTRLALRYRLVAPIEQGGMAVVWRAHDELLGRPVALKLLAEAYAGSIGGFELVRREARSAARLSHPNVTAVHDYAEAIRPDGAVAPFVVMELIEGETVAARLTRGPLRWHEAAAVGAHVADALAAAHDGGVVHRDITPGNVMLTPSGVKVVDFGISAAVGEPDEDSSGSTFGTPAYVAPERLDGLPALPATDVYALGCLLFEMVAGQPPYPVHTWEELAVARARPPGELPGGLPSAYDRLVQQCLAAEPQERPSAIEVADGLRVLTRSVPRIPHVATVRPAPRPPGWIRNRATAVRQAGLLVFTLGMLVAGTIAAAGPPPEAPVPRAAPAGTLGATAPDPTSTAAATRSGVRSIPETPGTTRESARPPSNRVIRTNDAFVRVRAAIEAGGWSGEIRADAATDLLNVLRTVQRMRTPDLEAGVQHLWDKVDDRAREGAIDPSRFELLRARLADLELAVAGSAAPTARARRAARAAPSH